MSVEYPKTDLTRFAKLIVGEGPSDFKFFKAFCAANRITKFDNAFTGMAFKGYGPSGFQNFKDYLVAVHRIAGFPKLTDLVLVFDSGDDADAKFRTLCQYIRNANSALGEKIYIEPAERNAVTRDGALRVHVLSIPHGANGGLESMCINAAKAHLDGKGENGTEIEGWVNKFADDACDGWTTEKRDKLRLQAFLSAAWKKKPDMHFSQVFDLTRDKFIPLTGDGFVFIRTFLQDIEML